MIIRGSGASAENDLEGRRAQPYGEQTACRLPGCLSFGMGPGPRTLVSRIKGGKCLIGGEICRVLG